MLKPKTRSRGVAMVTVLLKNGNVFSGEVIPQGKTVLIKLDDTGEVTLSSRDVVTVSENVLGLYQFQVNKTTRWDAGEHFHLAKWCIRQGLIEQSKHHYTSLESWRATNLSFDKWTPNFGWHCCKTHRADRVECDGTSCSWGSATIARDE